MVSLLFSFRGRINRKQYWIGTTLVSFVSIILQMMASAMRAGSYAAEKDPDSTLSSVLGASALVLPLSIVVLWCSLAVQFKRFHDRGRTGWISMAPIVVMLLMVITIVSDVFSGAPLQTTVVNMLPYFGILMLIGLGFFIDLGCMPGADGPNKYGPPPGSSGPLVEPPRPSGAVDAASSLFGAQSAMDRAIADARNPRAATPAPAAAAPSPAYARPPAQPAPAGFGRRVTR